MMNFDTLLSLAASMGLSFDVADTQPDSPFLYAWLTPDGRALYFGKARSRKRIDDELRWQREFDPAASLGTGWERLVTQNAARVTTFGFRFDQAVAQSLLSKSRSATWAGPALDRTEAWLASTDSLEVHEAERALIRLAVASGEPIANSIGAGMWEGSIGDPLDTLAQLAVVAAISEAE